jgi:hypothetical protein
MGDPKQLPELRADSGRRLPSGIIHGMTVGTQSGLQMQPAISGGVPGFKRTAATGNRIRANQKLKTLHAELDENFTTLLNDALQGASDYPVLNAVLGTAVGVGTGGASLLFTITTTAISMAKTSARVLARDGDEIWRVEEIGRVTNAGRVQPTYLLAYFLIDPYRQQSASHKGWLLHEARYPLSD